MRCSWKRILVCLLLACFALLSITAQAEKYYNQYEYETVLKLKNEGYYRFAYQIDDEWVMLLNSDWSYDLETGLFTLEDTGYVMNAENGWPEYYNMTWGWGRIPIDNFTWDELLASKLVWMYKLDGTGVLGKGAAPFSDGVIPTASEPDEEQGFPTTNGNVPPLGDGSIPLSVLCAMAGIVLVMVFICRRKQKTY